MESCGHVLFQAPVSSEISGFFIFEPTWLKFGSGGGGGGGKFWPLTQNLKRYLTLEASIKSILDIV